MKVNMNHIFCFATFSLLCVVANSRDCRRLKDQEISGISVDYVRRFADDALNVTKHIHGYVARLRKKIKHENAPPDAVKYYLFTSKNLKHPITLTPTKGSFKNIPYNNKKPLAFGIHGFEIQVDLTRGYYKDLIHALVKLNKYNVIFVDYTDPNVDVLSVAVPKAYLAAKSMAKFLKLLMDETCTKREQIHVIGISLGGQMAGIIGRFIPHLGRISGLDPGGTFFNDFPKDLRLDRSDAYFVDVIHAADEYPVPKGFGYYKPCGHLDFYPNGGLFQPGCNSSIPIDQTPTTAKEIAARNCMHVRMFLYYTESMCNKCTFVGTMCKSYERFKKGLCTACNSRTAVMGEFATKPIMHLPEDAKFFLDTNDRYPFCRLE